MKLIVDGKDQFEVPEGAKPVDFLLKSSSISFGCCSGVCGACVIQSSSPGLVPPSEHEIDTLQAMDLDESKYRLACQIEMSGDAEISSKR